MHLQTAQLQQCFQVTFVYNLTQAQAEGAVSWKVTITLIHLPTIYGRLQVLEY